MNYLCVPTNQEFAQFCFLGLCAKNNFIEHASTLFLLTNGFNVLRVAEARCDVSKPQFPDVLETFVCCMDTGLSPRFKPEKPNLSL